MKKRKNIRTIAFFMAFLMTFSMFASAIGVLAGGDFSTANVADKLLNFAAVEKQNDQTITPELAMNYKDPISAKISFRVPVRGDGTFSEDEIIKKGD